MIKQLHKREGKKITSSKEPHKGNRRGAKKKMGSKPAKKKEARRGNEEARYKRATGGEGGGKVSTERQLPGPVKFGARREVRVRRGDRTQRVTGEKTWGHHWASKKVQKTRKRHPKGIKKNGITRKKLGKVGGEKKGGVKGKRPGGYKKPEGKGEINY